MSSLNRLRTAASRWATLLATPILSLLTFLLAYWLDIFHFSKQPLAAIPAFFLSIIVMMIGQTLTTEQDLRNAFLYSDRIYTAIKDNLHITPVGSPEEAFRYLSSRMPILKEVKNTSVSVKDETEIVNERLYDTSIYSKVSQQISLYCSQGLIWKDVGDLFAVARLRTIHNGADRNSRGKRNGYHYKLINHNEPQINFIILEYEDGIQEVLFNWDFRAAGMSPVVLISRDKTVLGMFATHFEMLWRCASEDHDSHAISSTSAT